MNNDSSEFYYVNIVTAVLIGLIVGMIVAALTLGLERHTTPYTIVQESYTIQEKIDCMRDPNCNDMLIYSDLPQIKDEK